MENTQDYQDYQDYRAEILGIVRSNASPGIMRNKLEDYQRMTLQMYSRISPLQSGGNCAGF